MLNGCKVRKLFLNFAGTLPGLPTAPSTTVGQCGPGKMLCSFTKKCFSLEQTCDFIDSCGDGTDEATCGMINT